MKVKSESEIAQPCQTLSDPMDYSLPGSSIHGILQARVLEWGAIVFSITFAPDVIRNLKVLIKVFGEGNGNPLQYSCLENPTDGEAW